MNDLDELIRSAVSGEAGEARFDRNRWEPSVTRLSAPRRSRFPFRRPVSRNLAGVAVAAVLAAAIAGPLFFLSRLGTGPGDVRPAGSSVERYGMRIEVPDEWDSVVFLSGDTRYMLVANFELPADIGPDPRGGASFGGFSSELRDGLRPGDVTLFLQELTTVCPCPGFDQVELPISFDSSHMTSFEGVPNEHAFARQTFVVSDRWFDAWVEFGANPAPESLLASVNDVFATLRIGQDSGWVTHEDQDDAVTISAPESWTWREDPVPSLGEPRILFSLGTWDFPTGGECGPNPALEDLPAAGALVWLLEYRLPVNLDDFPPRPYPLSLAGEPGVPECSTAHPNYLIRFRDGFRFFQFHVALGDAATDATRRDVTDVLNSMWHGALPQDETMIRALELCDRLPWIECPLSDWVRNTIWEAGFAVDGRTDSAIVGKADGTSFYMWTTPDQGELESVYLPLMEVDGTPVYTDGTRAVWDIRGIRVWIQQGPTDTAPPSHDQIEALVRTSQRTRF
jgi:hypothetical protein